MNPIQAIFFDVGATLLTPAEDEGATFSSLAGQLGIRVAVDEVARQVPLMYELYEQLYEQDDSFWSDNVRAKAIWIEMYEFLAFRLDIPQQLRRELAEAVYQYYFSPGAWVPYDDVLPLLELLQARGIRMALISNWDSTLALIIEGLGLSPYFETIIASADVRLHKPMPEIFELALDRLGLDAQHALHVGDHLYADALGAAAVGITPVLLDRRQRHTDYDGLRVASLAQVAALL
ncbi:MAG: HAD-IA family hydrolase [Coriobacteriales bacterium]|nr:HAD-IA family hydrolase [Coriobacteriales bacterium]